MFSGDINLIHSVASHLPLELDKVSVTELSLFELLHPVKINNIFRHIKPLIIVFITSPPILFSV